MRFYGFRYIPNHLGIVRQPDLQYCCSEHSSFQELVCLCNQMFLTLTLAAFTLRRDLTSSCSRVHTRSLGIALRVCFIPKRNGENCLSRSGYVSAMCLIWSDFAIPSSRAKFGTVSGPALADVTHVLSCCVMSCYLASIRLGLYVPRCAQKVHALFNKSLLQTHTQHTAGTTSRPRSYAKARKVSVQVQPLYSVIKLPAV